MNITELTWPQRLTLIRTFNPDINAFAETFSVSVNEIKAALELQANGVLKNASVNVADYQHLFSEPPRAATKPVRQQQKRGRKSGSIAKAFAQVPTTPTDVVAFAADNSVSVSVLRQGKRFDTDNEGTVRVKKNKETSVLEIWRE